MPFQAAALAVRSISASVASRPHGMLLLGHSQVCLLAGTSMSPYLRCASLSVRPANDHGLIAKVIDLTFIGETIVEPRQHAHQIMIHIAHNGRDRIDRLRVIFIRMLSDVSALGTH